MYPNLVFISSLAESANPVAVVVLCAAAAASLAVASDGRAAVPDAAAAACHACCVCVSFFFLRNADASSTDIDPFASGRSPRTSCICSGAFVSTSVSTKQNSPELRNIAHFQCFGRNSHTSGFCDSRKWYQAPAWEGRVPAARLCVRDLGWH